MYRGETVNLGGKAAEVNARRLHARMVKSKRTQIQTRRQASKSSSSHAKHGFEDGGLPSFLLSRSSAAP